MSLDIITKRDLLRKENRFEIPSPSFTPDDDDDDDDFKYKKLKHDLNSLVILIF